MIYLLGFILIILLTIRFTHPTESTFILDNSKVVCRKMETQGRHYIEYNFRGKSARQWFRTKIGRDRAYLSLSLTTVRKALMSLAIYD